MFFSSSYPAEWKTTVSIAQLSQIGSQVMEDEAGHEQAPCSWASRSSSVFLSCLCADYVNINIMVYVPLWNGKLGLLIYIDHDIAYIFTVSNLSLVPVIRAQVRVIND